MQHITKYSLMLCLILISFNSFGQKKQKESKELKKANMLFQKKEYVKAGEEYLKMYEKDRTNAALNYHIGVCLYHQKDKQLHALSYFEKSNVQQFPEVLFYKGNLYHLLLRFSEAISSF